MTVRVLQDFLQYVFNNLLVQQYCLIRWIHFYKNICNFQKWQSVTFFEQQAELRNTSQGSRKRRSINQKITIVHNCIIHCFSFATRWNHIKMKRKMMILLFQQELFFANPLIGHSSQNLFALFFYIFFLPISLFEQLNGWGWLK